MPEVPSDKKLLLMPQIPEAEAVAVAEADPSQEGTALTFTGPLTRDSLSEYSEAQLIRNAKRVIPRAFKALAKLVEQGDRKALELALATYSYIGKGGGVTIVNNVLQQNGYGGASHVDRKQEVYFEGLIRAMDQQDQSRNSEDIIDAEEVD